ncbi:MAG: hypothetical protein IPL47_12270 [Phyllobacteriaceae bacterium]|nr:hypothetical protein [Phyllobacteriaceae bacterium]
MSVTPVRPPSATIVGVTAAGSGPPFSVSLANTVERRPAGGRIGEPDTVVSDRVDDRRHRDRHDRRIAIGRIEDLAEPVRDKVAPGRRRRRNRQRAVGIDRQPGQAAIGAIVGMTAAGRKAAPFSVSLANTVGVAPPGGQDRRGPTGRRRPRR